MEPNDSTIFFFAGVAAAALVATAAELDVWCSAGLAEVDDANGFLPQLPCGLCACHRTSKTGSCGRPGLRLWLLRLLLLLRLLQCSNRINSRRRIDHRGRWIPLWAF